jgi:hypothetical protein
MVRSPVSALGRVDAVVEAPPNVQPPFPDVDVAPAQGDRFAEAEAGVDEELYE